MSAIFWPRCYLCAYDPDTNASWLLLEDLSDTHSQTPWPLPPGFDDCCAALSQLARLHAHWWNNPDLELAFSEHLPLEKSWQGRMALALDKFSCFVDDMGDRLSTTRLHVLERVLASPNRSWLPGVPFTYPTLLHGDYHFWNVLFPRNAQEGCVILVD